MNTKYVAVIHKDRNSEYGVSFPDFPGCISAGKNLDEVYEMAQEALQFHVDGMVEEGLEIPDAMPMEKIKKTIEMPKLSYCSRLSFPEVWRKAVKVIEFRTIEQTNYEYRSIAKERKREV